MTIYSPLGHAEKSGNSFAQFTAMERISREKTRT